MPANEDENRGYWERIQFTMRTTICCHTLNRVSLRVAADVLLPISTQNAGGRFRSEPIDPLRANSPPRRTPAVGGERSPLCLLLPVWQTLAEQSGLCADAPASTRSGAMLANRADQPVPVGFGFGAVGEGG